MKKQQGLGMVGETHADQGWRGIQKFKSLSHHQQQLGRLNVRCAPGNLEERVTRRGTSA